MLTVEKLLGKLAFYYTSVSVVGQNVKEDHKVARSHPNFFAKYLVQYHDAKDLQYGWPPGCDIS